MAAQDDVLFAANSLCGTLLETTKRCYAVTTTDGAITPDTDLAEFMTTLKFVKTTLTPLVAAGPIVDPAAEICMRGVRDTLDVLTRFINEHILGQRVRLTVESWRDKRIYLYQLDFLLKQQTDQYASLFVAQQEAVTIIEDAEAQQLWSTAFGRRVRGLRIFDGSRDLFEIICVLTLLTNFVQSRSQWCHGLCFSNYSSCSWVLESLALLKRITRY
jgi:hypothetical protein